MLAAGEAAKDVARTGAEAGAGALGVAGGDGTLAGVAAVALEADLPFVPIPFGTRNHFARDVGFEPDDPIGALAAFAGGEERRVDVGLVGDRVFLNNVSLGVYASLVHDPRHRTKNRLVAFARMVAAVFGRARRPLAVSFEADGRRDRHEALVVVVSNNDYDVGTLADLETRARLDEGLLHAYVVEAAARRTLLALLARAAVGRAKEASGWAAYAAASLSVESARPRIHAAVDGEPVVLPGRLDFAVRPRALRVLVPPTRDGAQSGSEPLLGLGIDPDPPPPHPPKGAATP